MTLLEVEKLRKVYQQHPLARPGIRSRSEVVAVNDVSFGIEEGEILGLVGESGSGKSTLANCLLGLETPTSGTLRFRGELLDGRARKQLAGHIQAVFQDPEESLNPKMSIRKIVREPLEILGRGTPQWRAEQVQEMLKSVGLSSCLEEQLPHRLSGGQKQRVAIARALIAKPDLLVADEPVSALDVSVQAQILTLLADLRARLSLTIFFISHDLRVVGQLCDRVAVMFRGSLVEVVARGRLFGSARHPYTLSLLASIVPTSTEAAREWMAHSLPAWRGRPGPLREVSSGHWVADVLPEDGWHQ